MRDRNAWIQGMLAVLFVIDASACVVTGDEGPAPSMHARTTAASSGTRAAQSDAAPIVRRAGNTEAGDAGANPVATLSLMTWNLEWFADADAGPKDDATQAARVHDILARLDKNLVALEEVASEDGFARLAASLSGYASALSGYDWVQKTALFWDAARFELADVHSIEGLEDAGRPPLVVRLRDKADARLLVVVVIHAKAQADPASHQKRVAFATGLKARLDAQYPNVPLIMLGDFNDRLLGSITEGAESPYRSFVDDPHYAAPTAQLNRAAATEISYASGSTIDHVVVSDELAPKVIAGSIDVLRDELLAEYPSYLTTVSDHFPVTLSIAW